jgi:hypothetical protein
MYPKQDCEVICDHGKVSKDTLVVCDAGDSGFWHVNPVVTAVVVNGGPGDDALLVTLAVIADPSTVDAAAVIDATARG